MAIINHVYNTVPDGQAGGKNKQNAYLMEFLDPSGSFYLGTC